MKLIDKDAVVAEIERRIDEITQSISLGNKKIQKSGGNRRAELERFLSFIRTLEVKEVDLEKLPMWVREAPKERPFDDGWFIGMDDCLHRNGYKIKICDLWNLPKEPFNSRNIELI